MVILLYDNNGTLHKSYLEELAEYCILPFYNQDYIDRYIKFKVINPSINWVDVITYVNLDLDYRFYSNIKPILEPCLLNVLVNKHYQLPSDYIPKDLEEIKSDCSLTGLMLRHTARKAFEEMCKEAECEGIYLTAISTFRSFDYQEQVYLSKKIPEMKMEDYQKERDKVSARPGHSEHQTGLAVDINDLEETFENTPEGKWLAENSYKYGFILRYPKGKENITGYNYEPWHFRYIGMDLATAVYISGLTYDEYYIRYIYPVIKH